MYVGVRDSAVKSLRLIDRFSRRSFLAFTCREHRIKHTLGRASVFIA